MKHNPANVERLDSPRRITDSVDRQTALAVAAALLSGALILGITFWGTSSARGDEPGCPIMTVSAFADRLDVISERLRTLRAVTRYAMPQAPVFAAVSDLEPEEAFLRLASRCLRERDAPLNRIRSGQ